MSGRAAGPSDLPRVMAFIGKALQDENGIVATALPVPLAAGAAGTWLRYLPSVLGLVGNLRVYFDEQRGEVRSVALVRIGHRPEWVLLTLAAHPELGGADSAYRLLADLAGEAARHGVQRIFAAAPDRPSAHETLFQAGFYSYSRESWLVLSRTALPAPLNAPTARRASPADAHDLFRFYAATTPHAVQRAEQLRVEDFDIRRASAFDPPHQAGGDPLGLRRAAVLVERREQEVPRAMALAYEGRERHPHVLKVRTANGDVDAARDLARMASRDLPPGRPIASPVRAYEEHVARALLADGFQDAGTAMLFVKELAIRVEEPAFAPAVVR